MSLNCCGDTKSRRYYSWNAGYVFSTNERTEERKQRGQIRRGEKIEGVELTEAEEEGTRGVGWLYRRVCCYQQGERA